MSSNALRAPVIPFLREKGQDDDDVEYIKHSRVTTDKDNVRETTEERVPKLNDEATPRQILLFLAAFRRARQALQWTAGPKLFQKFRMHLGDDHLDVWDEIAKASSTQTVSTFAASLDEFKKELLLGYHYQNQISYLRSLKKPGTLTPAEFSSKLKAANRMAAELPDAPTGDAGLSKDELKHTFLEAMPTTWKKNLVNANMSEHTHSLTEIRNYMQNQSIQDLFVPNKKKQN